MRFRIAAVLSSTVLLLGCGGSNSINLGGGIGIGGPQRGTIVSSDKGQDYSKPLLNFIVQEAGTDGIVTVNSGATIYSVTYNTIDTHGNPTVASGAIAIPDGATTASLVSYQHSTATAKNQVPSIGGYLEGAYALAVFSGSGKYALCMPDYLGLGSNPGLHPFLNASSEASAAQDLITAARSFINSLPTHPSLDNKLFLAGYSQGGHATMALSQTLQNAGVTVTASAPMSGPYDLSGTEAQFAISNPGEDTPVFLAYLAVSYNMLYSLWTNPNQAFIPPFDKNAPPLFGANNQISYIQGLLPNSAQGLFQPAFITALQDPTSAANKDLQANDVYNWKPNMPMNLYAAESDEIVSYNNALKAYTTMHGLGASQVQIVNLGSGYTHAGAAPFAIAKGRVWFDSF
jgi:pimeloyl-ACP methyl ester carboxylesterase